jgi:transcriptional regulator with XRE-family HTH domain
MVTVRFERRYYASGTRGTFVYYAQRTSVPSSPCESAVNHALRTALVAAKLTEIELASACGVDVKTVGRWLSEEGRTPHPRHRWAVCERLGVEEEVLWPNAVRRTVKTGPDREVTAVYPFRSYCPGSVWRKLIANARNEIVLAGYTSYFLWLEHPNLRSVLRRKAERGCSVRFLIGDPDSGVTRAREAVEDIPLTVSTRIRITLDELAKIKDVPGIEARFSDAHIALSVFIFDQEMLVTPHLVRWP